jgi:hypothetical protein
MLLQDYINDVQEIVHDLTASSWPVARVISRINTARIDAARDMQCIRRNVTGIQLIPQVEIYNLNGAVAGAVVTSGGSGYGSGTTVPVTFSAPPPGGQQAIAFGNLVSGSLSSVSMTQWGQGYTSVPTVTVGGSGAGAVVSPVCLFQSNPLSSIVGNPLTVDNISFIWNQERRTLKYLSFFLFQAYARMWTFNFNAPPGVFSIHPQTTVVYIQPPPDQLYLAEWDIVFLPAPLVQNTDLDYLGSPWDQAVQFKAAEYLLMKHQNWGMVNSLEQKYDAYVPRIITTSAGVRIPNIYNRNFQRRVMR